MFTNTSRSPKDAIAAWKAALACASLVTSSVTVRPLSEYLALSSTSCSGLRAVATTRSPASSTASVNARPRPREAPVMSHTFDIDPLFAVHGTDQEQASRFRDEEVAPLKRCC